MSTGDGYRREVGRIKSTSLGFEDHGIFTAVLHMDYGNSGQSVGGYNLTRVAGTFIPGILRACGVMTWEELKGKTIYVLFVEGGERNRPVGIEPLPMDQGQRVLFADIAGE